MVTIDAEQLVKELQLGVTKLNQDHSRMCNNGVGNSAMAREKLTVAMALSCVIDAVNKAAEFEGAR